MPVQNVLASAASSLLSLYLIAVILRLLFQSFRSDFRNPLIQAVIGITNPPLAFIRRFIPGVAGMDAAPAALMVLVGLLKLALPLLIAGYQFRWGGALILSLANSLSTLLWILLIAVLARVVLSWVAPASQHPAARAVGDLSEPVMAPLRRILPAMGGLDFSPILTLMGLRLAQQMLSPLTAWGASLL